MIERPNVIYNPQWRPMRSVGWKWGKYVIGQDSAVKLLRLAGCHLFPSGSQRMLISCCFILNARQKYTAVTQLPELNRCNTRVFWNVYGQKIRLCVSTSISFTHWLKLLESNRTGAVAFWFVQKCEIIHALNLHGTSCICKGRQTHTSNFYKNT